jgi:hypothetical protein
MTKVVEDHVRWREGLRANDAAPILVDHSTLMRDIAMSAMPRAAREGYYRFPLVHERERVAILRNAIARHLPYSLVREMDQKIGYESLRLVESRS